MYKIVFALLSYGTFSTSLYSMQPRIALRLLRPAMLCLGGYYAVDIIRYDGQKTRDVVNKSTQTIKDLYIHGNTQLKIFIGATHDETIALLKKQNEEGCAQHKQTLAQLESLRQQNKELKAQNEQLLEGQKRVEEMLRQKNQKNTPLSPDGASKCADEKQQKTLQKIGRNLFGQ
jgi:hypothetical protein